MQENLACSRNDKSKSCNIVCIKKPFEKVENMNTLTHKLPNYLIKEYWIVLYVFCMDYHSGQWSRGYRLLSKLGSKYIGGHLGNGLIEECRKCYIYKHFVTKYGNKV
jgi:hypothetical protein